MFLNEIHNVYLTRLPIAGNNLHFAGTMGNVLWIVIRVDCNFEHARVRCWGNEYRKKERPLSIQGQLKIYVKLFIQPGNSPALYILTCIHFHYMTPRCKQYLPIIIINIFSCSLFYIYFYLPGATRFLRENGKVLIVREVNYLGKYCHEKYREKVKKI